MFTARFDQGSGLIECSTAGFHDAAEVEHHRNQVRLLARQATAATGRVLVLILASGMPVLTQEAVAAATRQPFGGLLGGDLPNNKMAVVVGSSLSRMQANRIFDGREARLFATEAEARAWLNEVE